MLAQVYLLFTVTHQQPTYGVVTSSPVLHAMSIGLWLDCHMHLNWWELVRVERPAAGAACTHFFNVCVTSTAPLAQGRCVW